MTNKLKTNGLAGILVILALQGCAALGGTAGVKAPVAGDDTSSLQQIRQGDRAYRSGDLDAALVQYVLALEKGKPSADLYYRIGTIHQEKDNLELAEESFRRAIDLEPSHLRSKEAMGTIHLRRGNYALANAMFTAVIKSDETRVDALNGLGVLSDLQENFPEAQKFYLMALEFTPNATKVLNNLGFSYYLQGNLELAAEKFDRVLSIDSDFDRAWSNLALVYFRKNELDKSGQSFNKVVDPHVALNNLGYLNLLDNNPVEARDYFEQAVKAAPAYYPRGYQNLESIEAVGKTKDKQLKDRKQAGLGLSRDSDGKLSSTPNQHGVVLGVPSHSNRDVSVVRVVEEETENSEDVEYTVDDIYFVQTRLQELGYSPGAIDGKLGRNTSSAIRQFRRDRNLRLSSDITSDLMEAL